ncbi:hypothetical protein DFS33DRAFT_1455287 [Desarmillaria ectypa]|nr:hypothetical protein DFS33DRAFT_1455287 [Desarmillaria ectypa]
MFSHILALLPLVALAVANPLVARSEVTALESAFDNMAQTVGTIDAACKAFAAHVDLNHALAIGSASQTLDAQIKAAIPLVPNHVVSDADGETLCTTLTNFMPALVATFEDIIARKNDFKSVGVVPAVCLVTENLAKDNGVFVSDLVAATPASYKACAQELSTSISEETGKVKTAFC